MEFPPNPRGHDGMRESVARWLAGAQRPRWQPVSLSASPQPWLGVACDAEVGRPWVWEVVAPALWERDAVLRDDPMTLVCERDVVLCRLELGGAPLWMQVPVRSLPRRIDVRADALVEGWTLELEAVWSRECIETAIDTWSLLECGHTVVWDHDEEPPARSARFEVDEGVWATGAAMDLLLAGDPASAAAATGVFAAVLEALGDHVERGGRK